MILKKKFKSLNEINFNDCEDLVVNKTKNERLIEHPAIKKLWEDNLYMHTRFEWFKKISKVFYNEILADEFSILATSLNMNMEQYRIKL